MREGGGKCKIFANFFAGMYRHRQGVKENMAKTPKFANAKVFAWVDKWNKICTPDKIVVVKGTKAEHTAICEMMVKKGQFIKLSAKKRPG